MRVKCLSSFSSWPGTSAIDLSSSSSLPVSEKKENGDRMNGELEVVGDDSLRVTEQEAREGQYCRPAVLPNFKEHCVRTINNMQLFI